MLDDSFEFISCHAHPDAVRAVHDEDYGVHIAAEALATGRGREGRELTNLSPECRGKRIENSPWRG